MNGIIQSFVSDFSFSIIILRFIYVVACLSTSFLFIAIIFHCMNTPHFVYPFTSFNGNVSCFHLVVTMNNGII